MIDGTRTHYSVELAYRDPKTGEDFRQGVTVLKTDHLNVATHATKIRSLLSMAKDVKRRESFGSSRLASPASAYHLIVRSITRTMTTEVADVEVPNA